MKRKVKEAINREAMRADRDYDKLLEGLNFSKQDVRELVNQNKEYEQ